MFVQLDLGYLTVKKWNLVLVELGSIFKCEFEI